MRAATCLGGRSFFPSSVARVPRNSISLPGCESSHHRTNSPPGRPKTPQDLELCPIGSSFVLRGATGHVSQGSELVQEQDRQGRSHSNHRRSGAHHPTQQPNCASGADMEITHSGRCWQFPDGFLLAKPLLLPPAAHVTASATGRARSSKSPQDRPPDCQRQPRLCRPASSRPLLRRCNPEEPAKSLRRKCLPTSPQLCIW